MPNLFDRTLAWLAHRRGFVLGPGVVDWADQWDGRDKSQYSPPEYGEYIRTSSAIYTCATLRASLLASLPIKIYRTNRAGEQVEVTRGPLVDLLRKVNPYWTRYRLIYMSEMTLCLWGEATWFLERGASGLGAPQEIWWARPDRVSILPDPERYVKGFLYEPLNGTQDIAFSPQETIWIPYPNPLDEYAGLAPLAAARASADYETEALRSNTRLFKNGMQIGGIVMPDANSARELTPDQAKELDSYFSRRFQGLDKAHRWATMRHHYEIWQGGTTPKDADYLGGMKVSLETVARVFKIPLDLIGGERTYANVEAALKALWMHCLLPEAEFIATELTEKLLPLFPAQAGETIKFDTSGVVALQEAEGEKWTRAKEQLGGGALLINEWRESVGQPAVPWGDVWWAPQTLRPIDDAQTFIDMQDSAAKALQEGAQSNGNQDAAGQGQDAAAGQDGQADDGTDDGQGKEDAGQGQGQGARAVQEEVDRALSDVRRRQRISIHARAGGDIPFAYARWVKEYRIALRKAGMGERDAQRLAHTLNTELYDQLRGETEVNV
jgi:HK97 family phage portal protein